MLKPRKPRRPAPKKTKQAAVDQPRQPDNPQIKKSDKPSIRDSRNRFKPPCPKARKSRHPHFPTKSRTPKPTNHKIPKTGNRRNPGIQGTTNLEKWKTGWKFPGPPAFHEVVIYFFYYIIFLLQLCAMGRDTPPSTPAPDPPSPHNNTHSNKLFVAKKARVSIFRSGKSDLSQVRQG